LSSRSSVLATMVENPSLLTASLKPRTSRLKNSFSMSLTTTPRVIVRPVIIDRATPLAW
jgi:hypothetical protein